MLMVMHGKKLLGASFFYTKGLISFCYLVLTKLLPIDGGCFIINSKSMFMGSENPRS